MDVILRYDIAALGRAGEAVTVAEGYARNYLLPRGLAEKATKDNLARIAAELRRREVVAAQEKEACQSLAARLAEISVTLPRKAGEDDKLFGSVTTSDIAARLAEDGITIDRRKIALEEPIRALGVFTVDVHLHPEVTASLRLWVVRE